jgi:hypothetical protein
VVVRRHLVQMMRLATGRLGPADLPSEAELAAYLAEHAERFTEPERVRLTHLYLSRDRRGDAIGHDAEGLLAAIRRGAVPPESAASLGDPFLPGREVGPASRVELERLFGPRLTSALEGVEPGAWVGPLESSYGLHLVWVHERLPARVPALDAVRGRVLQALLDERRAARSHERLAKLRARYEIRIEHPAPRSAARPAAGSVAMVTGRGAARDCNARRGGVGPCLRKFGATGS